MTPPCGGGSLSPVHSCSARVFILIRLRQHFLRSGSSVSATCLADPGWILIYFVSPNFYYKWSLLFRMRSTISPASLSLYILTQFAFSWFAHDEKWTAFWNKKTYFTLELNNHNFALRSATCKFSGRNIANHDRSKMNYDLLDIRPFNQNNIG